MSNYLWIGGKRYFYWDTYYSWDEAYHTAKSMTKKNKRNKYFIQITESFLTGNKRYKLYLTKFARMRFF